MTSANLSANLPWFSIHVYLLVVTLSLIYIVLINLKDEVKSLILLYREKDRRDIVKWRKKDAWDMAGVGLFFLVTLLFNLAVILRSGW